MVAKKQPITIWFLCGIILCVYGVTLIGAGIYNIAHPPAVLEAHLHLDLWWGFLLVAVSLVFLIHQRPGKMVEEED
jgi:hypothetical protein